MGFERHKKRRSFSRIKYPWFCSILIFLLASGLSWSKTKETKSKNKGLKSVTWFSEGRDSTGRGFVDRLEIFPNGKVEWQTTSRNSLCDGEVQGAGEGGLYDGEVKITELRKLQALLDNLEKDKALYAQNKSTGNNQKNLNADLGHESQATTYLMWESEIGVRSFNLKLQPKNFWNAERKKLLDQIQWEFARIKMRLSPKTIAKMESRWSKSSGTSDSKTEKAKGENFKNIEVHFSLLGPSEFSVILPDQASEAFMVEGGGEILYGKSKKAIFQKKKNVGDPFDHWVVQIRLPWGQEIERQIQKEKGIRLYYSANNLSHLRKGPWHDLNLCAFLPLEAKSNPIPPTKGGQP